MRYLTALLTNFMTIAYNNLQDTKCELKFEIFYAYILQWKPCSTPILSGGNQLMSFALHSPCDDIWARWANKIMESIMADVSSTNKLFYK